MAGECISTFRSDQDYLTTCVITPDGDSFATASKDGSMKLWNVHTASYLTTLETDFEPILDCAVTSNGSTIVSTSPHGLRLWNLATGECEASLEGHLEGVQSCAVTPDNSTVISGSLDYSLKLWDIDSGECIGTLSGHDDDVNSCAVAPDGSFIVSTSDDRTLKMWKPNFNWPRSAKCSEEGIVGGLDAMAADWEAFEMSHSKEWNDDLWNEELCGYANLVDIPALA